MKIVVVGYGAMGRLLVDTINKSNQYKLCGVIDKNNDDIFSFCFDDFKQITSKPDVIIDFSHPNNLNMILDYAINNNIPLVIATTGMNSDDINNIKLAALKIPILFTGNTSLGINLIINLLKEITSDFYKDYDIEVIEKHHNKKIDSPSGTAKMLVNVIESNLEDKYEHVHGRHEMRKRQKKEIGIHAVRGGTIVGEHQVLLAGNDEVIEIKHTAQSKMIFVNGALKAASYIINQQEGLYTMNDVLLNKNKEVIV